jgi:tetratricopeptide (TPR) repeat protein
VSPGPFGRWRRSLTMTAAVAAVVALCTAGVLAVSAEPDTDRPAGSSGGPSAGVDGAGGVAGAGGSVAVAAQVLQDRLRANPSNDAAWAELGSAYVELARITADPAYYDRADGALARSLRLRQEANGAAMLGMGALANARHDFAAARDWATRAQAVLPDTAAVYGVLADALTQLGDADGATAAVQRMLDLRPSVASFTRASYDLELRGDRDGAAIAMERALTAATSADELAFTRYHLGELALGRGRVADARAHYELGLAAAPRDAALRQGMARVAAAEGDLPGALAGYRDLVADVPLPQYLREYAALLTAAGRTADAADQFELLAQQQALAEAAGASDDLTAAEVAADRGDAAESLRRAEAEWGRRQQVLVADALAWALHLNGRDAEALAYAERAAALGTVDAGFAYHRGMILLGLGRSAEAAVHLATALRTDPHFSPVHAPLARAALASLGDR